MARKSGNRKGWPQRADKLSALGEIGRYMRERTSSVRKCVECRKPIRWLAAYCWNCREKQYPYNQKGK